MEKIKIPKDMDDAKALGTVLSKYKDTYYTQVLVAYFATYVLYPLSKDVNISSSPFCLLFRVFSGFHKKTLLTVYSVFVCVWHLGHFTVIEACVIAQSLKDQYHLSMHFSKFLPWHFVHSLQTFAIPGSIFLSILSGYLYPFPLALFLVCLVSNRSNDVSLIAPLFCQQWAMRAVLLGALEDITMLSCTVCVTRKCYFL